MYSITLWQPEPRKCSCSLCSILSLNLRDLSPSNNEPQRATLGQCRWKYRKIALIFGTPGRGFLLFLVFQHQHHGGHSFHGCLLSSLSPRAGDRGRGHFPLQGGTILMCRQSRRRHDYGPYHTCGAAPALRHNGCDSDTDRDHRGHVGCCMPTSQQPPKTTRFTVSSGAVAPRHRLAHRRRYQYAASQRAVG
jgi:hypothetical protein